MSRTKIEDAVLLFLVVAGSGLAYIGKLGFYSDDWGYQAALRYAGSLRLSDLLRALLLQDPGTAVRPVQALYLTLGYKFIGQHPFAFHLINTCALAGTTVVLYLVIRQFGQERWLALSIALVYGVLPHYSTDRFWISAHQAVLSVGFGLLGVYALSRAMQGGEPRKRLWGGLATVALVLSLLSYEVMIGALAAALVYIATRSFAQYGRSALVRAGVLPGVLLVLLGIGLVKAHLQTRFHIAYSFRFLRRLDSVGGHAVSECARFCFWTYGLHLPMALVRLSQHGALSKTAMASSIALGVLVTAYVGRHSITVALPSPRGIVWLTSIGIALYGLGNLLFVVQGPEGPDFTSPGYQNRMAIASALGAACVEIAVLSALCRIVSDAVGRQRIYAIALGLLCAMNCLAVAGISHYWADAVEKQAGILEAVQRGIPRLPPQSVILLDGICRYDGPANVLETSWDATGALQLTLHDSSLTADVITSRLQLTDRAVETVFGDDPPISYPYRANLFVFDVRKQNLTTWADQASAQGYMQTRTAPWCDGEVEGVGAKIF